MAFRHVLGLALLVPVLSGCTGLASITGSDGGDGLMSAEDALAEARELYPGSELVFVDGVEGPQPQKPGAQPERQATEVPLDDGADDGVLGDGRLSAWVVGLVEYERLLQVRIHADGRAPVEGRSPLPGAYADNEGHGDEASRVVGSEEAAAIAGGLEEVQEHAHEYPGAGYAYSYAPYSRRQPVRDWGSGGFLDAEDLSTTGWAVHGNSWTVVRLDPQAWVGDLSPTTARVAIDAATGKVLQVTVHVPRLLEFLLPHTGITFNDPIPPGVEPYVHRYPFHIPRGTATIEGVVVAFTNGPAVPTEVDPVIVRVVAPDGTVAIEMEGQFYYQEVKLPDPNSGEWRLEVTHGTPVPGSYHVAGILVAAVPLYD